MEFNTSPRAGDGVCEPCDVCVFCEDNCLTVDNSSQLDTEFDAMGNACDDDNDGILDVNDTHPLDIDNDGLDNAADDDDDSDGFLDGNDPLPLIYNYADGDLNDCGSVDAGDILVAERITLGLETATTVHLQHVDVSPAGALDGVIDLRDVLKMIRVALGRSVRTEIPEFFHK